MSPLKNLTVTCGTDGRGWRFASCLIFCLMPAFGMASEPDVDSPAESATGLPGQHEAQRVDTGFVFVDGKYLSAPYFVEPTEAGVLINGALIKAEQFPHINAPRRPGFAGAGQSGWQGAGLQARWHFRTREDDGDRNRWFTQSFSRPAPSVGLQKRVVHRLEQDAAIVAFDQRPLVVLEPGEQVDHLLNVFARRGAESTRLEYVLAAVPRTEDHDHWKIWLTTYEPPAQLSQRATERLEAYEAIESANQAQIAAVQRIDRYSYPLSIVGMVLAVLAMGHLLKSVPNRDPQAPAEQPSPQLMRFTLTAAALIFLLSTLDLAWTLLAAEAGQMRELNPFGQGLIADPASLIAFKLSATLLSCGLLAALRRHHTAQVASWWLCLVCTMLTFRWLMFNSMFMGS